jgi:hypothetical protein
MLEGITTMPEESRGDSIRRLTVLSEHLTGSPGCIRFGFDDMSFTPENNRRGREPTRLLRFQVSISPADEMTLRSLENMV